MALTAHNLLTRDCRLRLPREPKARLDICHHGESNAMRAFLPFGVVYLSYSDNRPERIAMAIRIAGMYSERVGWI